MSIAGRQVDEFSRQGAIWRAFGQGFQACLRFGSQLGEALCALQVQRVRYIAQSTHWPLPRGQDVAMDQLGQAEIWVGLNQLLCRIQRGPALPHTQQLVDLNQTRLGFASFRLFRF